MTDEETLDDHMVTIQLGVNEVERLLRSLSLLKLHYLDRENREFRWKIDTLHRNIETQVDDEYLFE